MSTTERTRASLLARLAQDVDRGVWIEFHDRYGELILGFARRRGLQEADCEDVAQEVLLTLMRAMPSFHYDPARGRFRSYLKTIVCNTISRKVRQNGGAPPLLPHDSALAGPDGNDEAWEQEWRQYHVRRAMQSVDAEFSERDRAVFSRYVLHGGSADETARDFDIGVDLVYQIKSRVLRRMSELIERQRREED